jgi:hypothetical protein
MASMSLNPDLETDEENLVFREYLGESFVFDLNEYFVDLDNDNLVFDAITEEKFFEENGLIRFEEVDETATVFFVAFDGTTETRSPPVTLNVVQKESVTPIKFLLTYCAWINWFLLFFVCLFIYFGLLKLSSRQQENKKEIPPPEKKETQKPVKKTTKKTAKKTAKKASKKTTKKAAKK